MDENINLNELREKAIKETEVAAQQPVALPITETKTIEPEGAGMVIDTPAVEDVTFDFGEETYSEGEVKAERMPTPEELGGGILIENKEANTNGTRLIGALANKETEGAIKEKFREVDEMIQINKQLSIIAGAEKPKEQLITTINIDKTGLETVEFTEEEREKMKISKKINIVEVDDVELKTMEVRKVSSARAKTILQRKFDKSCVPFIAVGSGYKGKIKKLTALEVVSLADATINYKVQSESVLKQAGVIYDKLAEVSIGDFGSFEEFIDNTATIDIDNFIFALMRATYPQDDIRPMGCANPECTFIDPDDKRTAKRTQFNHKYTNDSLLLKHATSEDLANMANYINENSVTVEDAREVASKSILKNVKRIKLTNSENESTIFELYVPSISETVNRILKPLVDTKKYATRYGYDALVQMTSFISAIIVKDTDENGNAYDARIEDPQDIIDYLAVISDDADQVNVLVSAIESNIIQYQFKYGFKGGTIVCPQCGHVIEEDQIIDIAELLFHKAQQRSTNA